MPIHYQQQNKHQLLVWERTEPASFFRASLTLSTAQEAQLSHQYQSTAARLEWLSSRYILQQLSGQPCSIFYKDNAGKLNIPNNPFHYSISHSGNYVAAAQAASGIGIDVQIPNDKLQKIAQKYIAPEVLLFLQQFPTQYRDYLHYYWGIKEALFKAYGKGQVKFIEHLHVLPFEASNEGHTWASLRKPHETLFYKIFYKKTTEYYLCTAIVVEEMI